MPVFRCCTWQDPCNIGGKWHCTIGYLQGVAAMPEKRRSVDSIHYFGDRKFLCVCEPSLNAHLFLWFYGKRGSSGKQPMGLQNWILKGRKRNDQVALKKMKSTTNQRYTNRIKEFKWHTWNPSQSLLFHCFFPPLILFGVPNSSAYNWSKPSLSSLLLSSFLFANAYYKNLKKYWDMIVNRLLVLGSA